MLLLLAIIISASLVSAVENVTSSTQERGDIIQDSVVGMIEKMKELMRGGLSCTSQGQKNKGKERAVLGAESSQQR